MPDQLLDSIKAPPESLSLNLPGEICGDPCCEDQDTTLLTKEQIVHEDKRDKHNHAQERLKDSQQNRAQRKEYANKIFWLVCAWLSVLTFIVCMTGMVYFNLSDTVLVALISGASINIIGLMVIVANYLFPKNGKK